MAVDAPGVDVVLLANFVVLVLAAALAWAWLTGRLPPRSRSADRTPGGRDAVTGSATDDAVTRWHTEAATLLAEVQTVAELDDGVIADRDRLARRLVPLSATLEGHAREAPPAVEEETVAELYALGHLCYEIGMEHSRAAEVRTGVFLEERLAALQERAEALEASLATE